MRLFHISDVLSVTTGLLVGSRHIDGVYEILNFLTGDSVYTHQIPRVMKECDPWLRAQFPRLFPDDSLMAELMAGLGRSLAAIRDGNSAERTLAVATWVDVVRQAFGMPELVPVYEMGADIHTHIDPVEEARAMVGDENVVVVNLV